MGSTVASLARPGKSIDHLRLAAEQELNEKKGLESVILSLSHKIPRSEWGEFAAA